MGLLPPEVEDISQKHLQNSSGKLHFEGALTHMNHRKNRGEQKQCRTRLSSFRKALSVLRSHNLSPDHIQIWQQRDSIMLHGKSECTLIRPGIALYGCKPDPGSGYSSRPKPLAALKGYIVRMNQVPAAHQTLGAHYVTEKTTWIATITPVWPGSPQFFSNKVKCFIRGNKIPYSRMDHGIYHGRAVLSRVTDRMMRHVIWGIRMERVLLPMKSLRWEILLPMKSSVISVLP
jgi:alanine racemase